MASKLAGLPCRSDLAACEKCLLTENPKSENKVTAGIALAFILMSRGKPSPSLIPLLGIDRDKSELIAAQRKCWKILHTSRMDAAQFALWLKSIPVQCNCGKSFEAILQSNPPRFDDWQKWTWEIHNAVNRKIGKSEVAWDDAVELWNWNKHQSKT
jgi:hypothetical protein